MTKMFPHPSTDSQQAKKLFLQSFCAANMWNLLSTVIRVSPCKDKKFTQLYTIEYLPRCQDISACLPFFWERAVNLP